MILAISQFDHILRIGPNLLSGGLISRGSDDGIHNPVVASSTTKGRELHPIKNHKICMAEGQDIGGPVSSAVVDAKILYEEKEPFSWK